MYRGIVYVIYLKPSKSALSLRLPGINMVHLASEKKKENRAEMFRFTRFNHGNVW